MGEKAIVVKNLHKEFVLPHQKITSLKEAIVHPFSRRTKERQKVLDGISFEIKKGEFFGIVGRNGSGKSTLLKILAGVYAPTSGDAHVNGKLTPFIELGVGFNPDLSGRDNVFLNGALLGFSRKEMESMYDEIVEFAELERFMDQKLKNYSSGMQVRLAFSIAIRANNDILLIDEVLAVGDANFQLKCFSYFHRLKEDGKTVIFVSHDMNTVKRFCNRAILIENGKLILDGTPAEVGDSYTIKNMKTLPLNAPYEAGNRTAPIYIRSVQLRSNNEKASKFIATGDDVKLRVSFINTTQRLVNFSIGLHSEENGYVFTYNTQMDEVSPVSNSKYISLSLKNIPILQGTYHINISCYGDTESVPYDYIPKALIFRVTTKGKQASYRGMLNVEHKWEYGK
jgi:ABC-2 type transport system ATP-binding protein